VSYQEMLFLLLCLNQYFFQFRHQICRGIRNRSCCSCCCQRNHSIKGHHNDIIDKAHHQLYASTANASQTHINLQLQLEQGTAKNKTFQSILFVSIDERVQMWILKRTKVLKG